MRIVSEEINEQSQKEGVMVQDRYERTMEAGRPREARMLCALPWFEQRAGRVHDRYASLITALLEPWYRKVTVMGA